jgi:hypothetical protein
MEVDYIQKVFVYLYNMGKGEFLISQVASPDTRDKFIEAVKLYIDNFDHNVEFTNDYQKVRKHSGKYTITNQEVIE